MDDRISVALRAIKYSANALVAQVDQIGALVEGAPEKSAPSKAPAPKARKARAPKSAAQSFAEEVIEEITTSAEEIEAHGEINNTDLSKEPKKRGRPKGSKNKAPSKSRPHGQLAAIIRARIEDLGVGESITTAEIGTLCQIAPPNASREASKLLEAGVLERAGRGAFRIRAIPAA